MATALAVLAWALGTGNDSGCKLWRRTLCTDAEGVRSLSGVIKDHKDLEVWQEAMKLCKLTYRLTDQLPDRERYGLCSQMCRAAVSIPSNIAEGYARGSQQDYIRFVKMSRGSAAELETQLLLARDLFALDAGQADAVQAQLDSVRRLIAGLLRALER